jgi:sigma-E factor negative regulatory protein RseB
MTPGVKRVGAFFALFLLTAAALAATEAEQPRNVRAEIQGMIERMAQALRTLSYSGNLVYLHGSQLESLELAHTVRDGEEFERLISLNGAAREVLRNEQAVTCVLPDAKSVSVEQRPPARPSLLPVGNMDLERLQGNYLLYPLGAYRVADRPVQVLGIIPKDEYRYGYRFYLDQETGLPLKTDLMGVNAKPIEQIMFTSLVLDSELENLPVEAEREGFQRILREAPVISNPNDTGPWAFRELPAGFELHVHNHRRGLDGERVEHFVLSDGLASVSVYLERDDGDGLQGAAHVGAVNAWGSTLREWRITAVGEVPAETVQAVVRALDYRGEAP